MTRIMRRLESGERWWAAEIVLRFFGLVFLGLCAAAALWLYQSLHQPPPHAPKTLDYVAALVVVLGWSLGWSFLVEGPGLFQLIEVPARYRRFTM